MVRIDTSSIKKWGEIVSSHKKYCELNIDYDRTKFDIYKHETICFLKDIKLYREAIAIHPFHMTLKELGISDEDINWFDKIENLYNHYLKKCPKSKRKLFRDNLKSVFNYNKFSQNKSKENWNRHKLLSDMGIRTCCYCNRQYITHYEISEKNDKKKNLISKSTADLDHFYPQSSNPYLALSLYNFIPSCSICNSRFKLAEEKDIIYPYNEGFGDDAFFELYSKDGGLDYIYRHKDISIKINAEKSSIKEKVDKSNEMFRLDEIYQTHEDYAGEIIKKIKMFNSEEAINDFYKKYGKLFADKEELKRTLLGNYYLEKDLSKRPLSKLTRDILIKHGIHIVDN